MTAHATTEASYRAAALRLNLELHAAREVLADDARAYEVTRVVAQRGVAAIQALVRAFRQYQPDIVLVGDFLYAEMLLKEIAANDLAAYRELTKRGEYGSIH